MISSDTFCEVPVSSFFQCLTLFFLWLQILGYLIDVSFDSVICSDLTNTFTAETFFVSFIFLFCFFLIREEIQRLIYDGSGSGPWSNGMGRRS